jgi:hypothetical protein
MEEAEIARAPKVLDRDVLEAFGVLTMRTGAMATGVRHQLLLVGVDR